MSSFHDGQLVVPFLHFTQVCSKRSFTCIWKWDSVVGKLFFFALFTVEFSYDAWDVQEYCTVRLNVSSVGLQNVGTSKDCIYRFIWNWDTVADTCLNLTFRNKLLIDSWFSCCSNSKVVNPISDHGFKCLSKCLISINNAECVAKIRFTSAFQVQKITVRFMVQFWNFSRHFRGTEIWFSAQIMKGNREKIIHSYRLKIC